CDECSAVLEELRAVTARARSLDDRPPTRDLWAGVAERIGATANTGLQSPEARSIDSAPSRRRKLFARRVTLGLPQLAAAAVALVVVSGAGVGALLEWRATGNASVRSSATGANAGAGVLTVANVADLGGARYDSAVAELEQALAANTGNLDS